MHAACCDNPIEKGKIRWPRKWKICLCVDFCRDITDDPLRPAIHWMVQPIFEFGAIAKNFPKPWFLGCDWNNDLGRGTMLGAHAADRAQPPRLQKIL